MAVFKTGRTYPSGLALSVSYYEISGIGPATETEIGLIQSERQYIMGVHVCDKIRIIIPISQTWAPMGLAIAISGIVPLSTSRYPQ
jgi:hypothetical protein